MADRKSQIPRLIQRLTFNPGSTMAADPGAISHIIITTNLACAAGMLAAPILA